MTEPESTLSSRLERLNPFSKSRRPADDEDLGEEIKPTSVAGGGRAARRTEITKHQLRVSSALKSFIVHKGILSEEAVGIDPDEPSPALKALIDRPHINVPAELTNRSHPLPEYFISSSHNTYLLAHQLYGTSSATAYEVALGAGSRCVEIDAWDSETDKDEPKVTHGYTLVSHITFRAVCETIRDVVDKEAAQSVDKQGYKAAPIFLSLENHCGAEGQLRLVQIMQEIWGERLLSKAIIEKTQDEEDGSGQHVTLAELESKIVVIVEYHIPNEVKESDSDSSSSSDEDEERNARKEYKKKKEAAPPSIIIPELAELGVYAQSVKPADNSWFEQALLKNGPHHHLINVSEVGIGAHLPIACDKIARHNAKHLIRIFPKGTRISSRNLNPVPFWGIGAQITALNWQKFDASMQLNEALFSGSEGYVLKPSPLRAGGDGKLTTGEKKKLLLQIAGASDIPIPAGRDIDSIKPYVTCSLIHPDNLGGGPPKKKTSVYKQHKLDFLHRGDNPPVTDPIWDETLEWEYDNNELVFLRILLKSDDKFAGNPKLVVTAVRLLYTVSDWTFIRMLDLSGRETTCSLLVKFDISDA